MSSIYVTITHLILFLPNISESNGTPEQNKGVSTRYVLKQKNGKKNNNKMVKDIYLVHVNIGKITACSDTKTLSVWMAAYSCDRAVTEFFQCSLPKSSHSFVGQYPLHPALFVLCIWSILSVLPTAGLWNCFRWFRDWTVWMNAKWMFCKTIWQIHWSTKNRLIHKWLASQVQLTEIQGTNNNCVIKHFLGKSERSWCALCIGNTTDLCDWTLGNIPNLFLR